MVELKILAPIANFGVILVIWARTLDTACFSPSDINLSMAALIFSMMVEIIYLKRR